MLYTVKWLLYLIFCRAYRRIILPKLGVKPQGKHPGKYLSRLLLSAVWE